MCKVKSNVHLQELLLSWTIFSHTLAFHSYLHVLSLVFVPYVELLGSPAGLPGRQPTIFEAFTSDSFSPPFSAESFSIESTFSSLTVELNFKTKSTITLTHLGGSEQKEEFQTGCLLARPAVNP